MKSSKVRIYAIVEPILTCAAYARANTKRGE